MKNMFIQMNKSSNRILSIVIQLNDCQLSFEPPLIPMTSQLSLEEIFKDWIESFINRGDLINLLGFNQEIKETFTDLILEDSIIFDLKEKLNQIIEETCQQCLEILHLFSDYSFLYQYPVNQSFQLFLNGEKKQKLSTPKNFLNEQDAGRRFVYYLFFKFIFYFLFYKEVFIQWDQYQQLN